MYAMNVRRGTSNAADQDPSGCNSKFAFSLPKPK